MLAGMGGSCLLAPSHRGLLSLSDSPKSVGASPSWFEQVLPSLRNALYRNNRDGSFTDVTQKTWCFWHFVLDETDHGFTMTAS
jgi:hypothetical protein